MLDADHSGLEKVKDRVLEYLAVRKLNPDVKGPILCFLGPPGVGKTSLARSIANSIGRKFVRVSLGGMRDEAEIRGHRRTYIGALPGQVIQGIRRAESKNPVFILDEIDKLGSDFRGDPASALLEVLDPEQNNTFRDHYLDVPFDLSEVLFLTTANVLDPIPPALRDRMEVLELAGYTEEEKLQIAFEHLIAKQVKNNGLTPEQVEFTEAGHPQRHPRLHPRGRRPQPRARDRRALPQGRPAPRGRGRGEGRHHARAVVVQMLGAPSFLDEEIENRTKDPGVAVGLAWTPAGGEVLFVEASRMQGGGSLTLTGHLGDVMKESARTALSWFRAHAQHYGVDPSFYKDSEIHLHVPSGAIPKDGPSAGVTMVSALASQLTGRPVRGDIAMTGEITLSGRVLPVGGIKEKVLAARRHGITELIMPRQNEKNVKEDLTRRAAQGADDPLRQRDQRGGGDRAAAGRAADARRRCRSTRPPSPAGGVKVFYSPRYEVSLPGHIWPTSKYRLIAEPPGSAARRSSSRPMASWDDLALVHTGEYLDKLRTNTLTAEDIATLELPWQPELADAFRLMVGGTIAAAAAALEDGLAAHLGGGLHHAFANHGEGFCPLNDVAVAIRVLQRRPARAGGAAISRAAVVDLDVHHGNGTSMIFERDPDVFTFSIHQQHNYPFFKPRSDLDIGLEDGAGDERLPGVAGRRAAARHGQPSRPRRLSRRRGSVRKGSARRPQADQDGPGRARPAGRRRGTRRGRPARHRPRRRLRRERERHRRHSPHHHRDDAVIV